jgi:hypothetical protein
MAKAPWKVMRKLLYDRMRLDIDEDCALEVVAKKHRLDRDVADDHRWDRQHDQGQGHHPGCLVRLLTRGKAMVFGMRVIRRMGVIGICK